MCYNAENLEDYKKMEEKYARKLASGLMIEKLPDLFGHKNAFTFPNMLVITNKDSELFQSYRWGLLPSWTQDPTFAKNTLNAKSETLAEKPSFRNYINNRCIIPITAFTEWQSLDKYGHMDPNGKVKRKFRIHSANNELFALGGIFNKWIDKGTGEEIGTFSVVTKPAEGIMKEIHNSKLRMPLLISIKDTDSWLTNGIISEEVSLIAESV